MGRYIQDQNKVAFLHESGTYGSTSGPGIWPGQVTDHSIDDTENKIEGRFLGASTRSFSTMDKGPRDVTGTLTYNPQNMMIPAIAIGSVTVISGTDAYQIDATQVDTDVQQSAFTSGTLCPPRSFTLEDSKQSPGTGKNFVRTITGVIPSTTTITATQGEKVTVTVDYVGQNLAFSSGTTTSITEDTITPYLWSSVSVQVAGSDIVTTKEAVLEISQNIEPPHYLNGSRDISTPFPGNRENTFNLTIDLESTDGKMLYEDIYKANAEVNCVFDMNQDGSTGSQHTTYTLSGARITTMDNPSLNEGVTESTVEIKCENVTMTEFAPFSSVGNVNPW